MLCTCNFCCQSVFGSCRGGSNGKQQLDLMLSGDEASDYINFVVKDTSSGTWYDQGGTNYHIPLTGSVAMMSIDEQIPDAELPDLPGELCGIWSYIKWEQAGCPNRNEQESQAAYRHAIQVHSCLVLAQHALLSSALNVFLQIASQLLGGECILLLGAMLPAAGALGKQQSYVLAYALIHWPSAETAHGFESQCSSVCCHSLFAACPHDGKGGGMSV